MAHAPLLLDTALDLSPSKPLGFCAARALVRSRNYHLLQFRKAFSSRCAFERPLSSRAAGIAVGSQCVLFGIVISIFILQALQRYNPQEGCRMLASEMKDHVIVVGHSHLGARLVAHLRQSARAYVLIDKDPAAVDDLVRAGEPVVVDDAKQE